MAVTLQQIAERAGVSQATVSIALGSTGRVGDKTRRRIQSIADELGYRPNLLVHGIQTGRTMTIGVLMVINDAFCAQIFQGIQNSLAGAGYVPIVLGARGDDNEIKQLHALIDRRVDGILLRPSFFAKWERHLGEALQRGVPVVAVDVEPHAESPHIDFVGSDDVRGSTIAAQALLDAGHRRLGVVTTGRFPDRMLLRQKTFEDEIAKMDGASCVSASQPWCDDIDGYPAAVEVLKADPRPTAVFATIDMLSVGVYRAAVELGLSIPRDLSVIGYSDTPVARHITPKLTAIHQTPVEIGMQATELLLKQIEQRRQNKKPATRTRTLLQCELIERDSVAPPPATNHSSHKRHGRKGKK